MNHWSDTQQARLFELMDDPSVNIAYWNSDAQGRPTNGGSKCDWYATPGAIQELPGPLVMCGPGALHATVDPLKWAGCRVWLVAMHSPFQIELDKVGSLKREILGEIFPEQVFCQRLGARLGRKDLSWANLSGADLYGANLSGADLSGATLYRVYRPDGHAGYKVVNGCLENV